MIKRFTIVGDDCSPYGKTTKAEDKNMNNLPQLYNNYDDLIMSIIILINLSKTGYSNPCSNVLLFEGLSSLIMFPGGGDNFTFSKTPN